MPGVAQRRGRPAGPTAETQQAVLQVAFGLLCNEGPGALTPLRIHQVSGVARTTVYRHWPTPASIVEAILARAIARDELDDLNGELEHDLHVAVGSLVFRLGNRPVRLFYDAIRLHVDPDRDEPLSERYIRGLIAPVRDVVAAAIDRGDLSADADAVDGLVSQLCGPLVLDHVLLGRAPAATATEDAVARFLARHHPLSLKE